MIRCEHLVKRYSNVVAVNDLNLDIIPGQIYALIGPNGSGKSTFMKMLGGITKPTSGAITLDGRPISYKDKAHIAYMPTESYFFNYMNCIQFGRYYQDFFEDFNMDKYMYLLQQMELDPKRKCREMSTGMAAKLKIAITLSRDSYLIMLDEPLNGIDIIARDKIISTIRGNITGNTSVIMSSHLVDEMEQILSYLLKEAKKKKENECLVYNNEYKNGSCVLTGPTDQLRNQYQMNLTDMYRQIYA